MNNKGCDIVSPLWKNTPIESNQISTGIEFETVERDWRKDFQTPPPVCKYMASLVPQDCKTVLEPTSGIGNIVRELKQFDVTAPSDFFLLNRQQRFDAIVMNPPFSSKSAFLENAPPPILENMECD